MYNAKSKVKNPQVTGTKNFFLILTALGLIRINCILNGFVTIK